MRRPVLAEVLEYLRAGDTLVVWKLDRLGRTLGGMVKLADSLREKGVELCSVSD